MKLSILIPTFQRPDRLTGLLAVLGTQIAESKSPWAREIEIVVIDNCPEASARKAVPEGRMQRYVHEPRPGVANARNTGVREARGAYALFIDDDEIPDSGWLDAFLAAAEQGHEACFGPIEPDFEAPPPEGLKAPLEAMFSRRLQAATGSDITAHRAFLGTGNSMFLIARCLSGAAPFNPRFNGGGEDVWLLRQLVDEHGVTLRWCAQAGVREVVPASRMTLDYVMQRKFRSGQLRCLVESGAAWPKATVRITFWMMAGAVQFAAYRLVAIFSPRKEDPLVRASGGLGKLLWWRYK